MTRQRPPWMGTSWNVKPPREVKSTTHSTSFDPDAPVLLMPVVLENAELLEGPLQPEQVKVLTGPMTPEQLLDQATW